MLYRIEIDSSGRWLWKQEVFYQPSYLGSNAFGLTKRIQPIMYLHTALVAKNYDRYWGNFKMQREDAIQHKFNLQARACSIQPQGLEAGLHLSAEA